MLKSWNLFEKVLLGLNILIGGIVFYITRDFGWLAWLGFVSSLTNVICVILCAKKKTSNYVWGTIGVITYGIVAYAYANTGEWMLNWLYFLPLQFVGLAHWNRSINHKILDVTGEVPAHRISTRMAILIYSITAVLTLVYAKFISLPDVQMFLYGCVTPREFLSFLVASTSTMLSVVAMVLMVKRYQEQWVLWIVVDILSVVIWCITFNPMMILQWSLFLANAVYGYIKWKPSSFRMEVAKDNS